MAKFIKMNLKFEIEDGAKKRGVAGQEMHYATNAMGLEHGGLSYQRFEAGHRIKFGHRHSEQEEICVILSGSGQMKLDDDIIDLAPLDAVKVPAGTTRALEAGPDGIEFLVFGSPRGGNDEVEMLQDWWK